MLTNLLRGPAASRRMASGSAWRVASQCAAWQVQAFYLFFLLLSFDLLRRVYGLVGSGQTIDPLWPIGWATHTGLDTSAYIVGLMLPIAALAALWRPYAWLPRLLVAISLLKAVALINSFGSINHSLHYPLWIAWVLLLAPAARPLDGTASISVHMRWLMPIFAAQVTIAVFYTLSGLHKAYHGFFPRDVSSFDPMALPLLVMERWHETGEVPMLGQLFADNLALAWPAYLLVIYFELVFLVAVFRPQLHRLFGFVFVIFHTGVWLVMGIAFPYQPIMVALLFIWSPFAGLQPFSIRQTLAQLPGIDLIIWSRRAMYPGQTTQPGHAVR